MSAPVFVKLEDQGPGALFQTLYMFHCPGCKCGHWVRTAGDESRAGPVWQWNGDIVKPTVSPSILVCPNESARRCHSFIRDGKIEFCNDCHHELAGQTIPLESP